MESHISYLSACELFHGSSFALIDGGILLGQSWWYLSHLSLIMAKTLSTSFTRGNHSKAWVGRWYGLSHTVYWAHCPSKPSQDNFNFDGIGVERWSELMTFVTRCFRMRYVCVVRSVLLCFTPRETFVAEVHVPAFSVVRCRVLSWAFSFCLYPPPLYPKRLHSSSTLHWTAIGSSCIRHGFLWP